MLRVTPLVFYAILQLIENHPVFLNHLNHAQTAVEQQLAVTLYQMGHFGNATSVEDVTGVVRGQSLTTLTSVSQLLKVFMIFLSTV